MISVDTKKKELVGQYKNGGRRVAAERKPGAGEDSRLPGPAAGQGDPYGVYDIAADAGWVSVGTDHDTAEFAVDTIRRWWQAVGADRYPHA